MRRTHPFGNLLSSLRARKQGLTQARLAELAGYDPAVIARMGAGQKDLTGTQARERILRVIQALDESGVLNGAEEANALLAAAELPPLYSGNDTEAALMKQLEIHQRSVMQGQMPARRAASHAPPTMPTSFIGREPEIKQIGRLLQEPNSKLITLIGPGGVGKTRLAIEVAGVLRDDFADGVWWMSLAALGDGAHLLPLLDNTFALGRSGAASQLDALTDYLDQRRALVVLDNCEHLIDACASLVAHLISQCEGLHVLCTSREALLVPGELTLYVPPLNMPRAAKADANAIGEFDAVRLFVERARAIRPGFALVPSNAQAVAHICEQLDGIPLALELAAALLQVLAIDEIAARIDKRFALLKGGYRTAMPRHQTLSNAMDWSYELLNPAEQILLARLSIFAGAWSIDDAEAVCAAAGLTFGLTRYDVLPTLRQLVNKSLVVMDDQDATSTRFRLLKTIQEYAAEKLRERKELSVMKDSQLYHLVELAEAANAQLGTRAHVSAEMRLLDKRDDLRAALMHAERQGMADTLLRLTSALQHFWRWQGARDEGTRWMDRALALAATAPAKLRIAVLYEWSEVIFEHETAHLASLMPRAEECLNACRIAHNPAGTAQALTVLGSAAERVEKDYSKAQRLLEEALLLFTEIADQRAIHVVRQKLGAVYQKTFPERVGAWFQESIALHTASGSQMNLATTLADLAWSSEPADAGAPQVLELWRRAVAAAREADNRGLVSEFLSAQADAELIAGDRSQAAEHFEQSLTIACEMDSAVGIQHVLVRLWGVDEARAQSAIKGYLFDKHGALPDQALTLQEAARLVDAAAAQATDSANKRTPMIDATEKRADQNRTTGETSLNIRYASVQVDDQDKALRFYTSVLGFVKKNDAADGPYRWLTVVDNRGPAVVELELEAIHFPSGRAYQRERFDANYPSLILHTNDILGEFERLKNLGVVFRREPMDGGPVMTAFFEDTCGNIINMTQPHA